nr:CAP domain-containing protein [uncultured Desulfobacter sp.]
MNKRTFRAKYVFMFIVLFFLCIGSGFAWAGLEFSMDEDCDVDGEDIHAFVLDDTFSMGDDLSGLAGAFGTVQEDCSLLGGDDPVDGYPKWRERALIVFVNMVRMAPREYFTKYMADWEQFMPADGILSATRFPAVHPLCWNLGLNQAARYHAEDMAFNCQTFQHASCDGTSPWDRIKRYYLDFSWIGENIALGYSSPRHTVNQLLCDQYGGVCVVDGSAYDGHRDNIMSGNFNEMGGGHAEGNYHYWVQDFGARDLDDFSPIVSATHYFLSENATTFFLNYYDPQDGPPAQVSVIVDDSEYNLVLDTGSAQAGTYRKDLTSASGCRSYYFMVKTGDGTSYRYPEAFYLHTYGEGGCTSDYGE